MSMGCKGCFDRGCFGTAALEQKIRQAKGKVLFEVRRDWATVAASCSEGEPCRRRVNGHSDRANRGG